MTGYNSLVEQNILEYEARRKHFDELLERAEKGVSGRPKAGEYEDELATLRQERQKLVAHIEELKQKTREEWQEGTIEEVGPMFVWEAVAKRLENLVERIEH